MTEGTPPVSGPGRDSITGEADSPIAIRPIQREDFLASHALWDRYLAFYGRTGLTSVSEAVTRTTWARFLDPAVPIHALVADHHGKVLGFAHYLFHSSTTQIQPCCYLEDLFTDEESRGQGIGRALIAAVCMHAQQAGSTSVYWQTQKGNRRARRLYDRVARDTGFMVYSRGL